MPHSMFWTHNAAGDREFGLTVMCFLAATALLTIVVWIACRAIGRLWDGWQKNRRCLR